MTPRRLVALGAVAIVAALLPGAARALDECRGLDECVPVVGPWVVVPPAAAGDLGVADWDLRCPLPGFIVGGSDSRVTDRGVDVSIRGETGSPVAPGVTTRRALVFTARTASRGAGVRAFKPAIGCIPLEGGGGRAQTSIRAGRAVVKPRNPFVRVVAQGRLASGGTRAVVAVCPAGRRVVAAGHAVAFRRAAPPSEALVAAVEARRTASARSVRVVATLARGVPTGGAALVQVQAVCAKEPA